MTWLVTGGSGFLGRHVLEALRDRAEAGERVVALGRHHPGGWPCEAFWRADLDDPKGLASAVDEIAPDFVIHAAGKTPPASSTLLYRANTRATAFLLEALANRGRSCRVVLAGSAGELGPVPVDRLPVSEDHPCRPSDAYGLSKWAATRLGMTAPPPLEVVSARIFNPVGPGLPTSQAFGRFAALLADPRADPVILNVGGLDARRDFVDVRDAAFALVTLAEQGGAGRIYHVGTGRSRSVGEGLDALIRLSGREVRLELDREKGRGPTDSRADISRIVAEAGWSPRMAFESSLADLWDEASRRARPRRVA